MRTSPALAGVDYWSRLRAPARGEFQRFGYFPGKELSTEEPLLSWCFAGAACSSSDRYVGSEHLPAVRWTLVGYLDERLEEGK